MYIDSHCHLNILAPEPQRLQEYVQAALDVQVEHLLCISIDTESMQQVLEIAQTYDCISASAGIHPNVEVDHACSAEFLYEHAKHPAIVAIGETGLDYFRSEGDLTWQRVRFIEHIEVARALQKPLIIHTREAKEDTMQLLRQHQAQDAGGIIHCFTEDWATAKQSLDLGFYISFSGIVTFKNATQLQAVAEQVPLDRILIETDAPYLAPVPHRGQTNQPAYVVHVAEYLAKLRGMAVEEIAAITTENFYRLFPSTQTMTSNRMQ